MKVFSFGYNQLDIRPPNNCQVINVTGLPYPTGSKSGLEEETQRQVLATPKAGELVRQALASLHKSEDVAFGCASGFQRSVALAEEAARQARTEGLEVEIEHLSLKEIL